MNKNKVKNKLGYSLIETLVALGILLIGIIPILGLSNKSMLLNQRASEIGEAAIISESIIDYIKSRGYDKIESLGNFITIEPYMPRLTTNGGYTIKRFGSDFGISNDMILLNSTGINLSEVSIYITLQKVKGRLKSSNGNITKAIKPETGEESSKVYDKGLIYGKIIFGMGPVDNEKKTKKSKELETTFIITPIENWK